MKFFSILFFCLLFSGIKSEIKFEKMSNLLGQEAIEEIFREFFKPYQKPIDVIVLGSSLKVDKILSFIQNGSLLMVRKSMETSLTRPTMIISNNTRNVVEFFYRTTINSEYYQSDMKILVYAENVEMEKIIAPTPMFHLGHAIEYSYFIVNSESEIKLKTFEWWTENACNVTQLITINTFNKSSMKWQKFPLEISQKFANFHNCTFITLTSMNRIFDVDKYVDIYDNPIDPSMYRTFMVWRNVFDSEIMTIFAKRGNYSVIPTLRKFEPGLQIFQISRTYLEHHLFYNEHLHTENMMVFLIPKADVYNSYEKLIFPFDKTTWILLLVTFILSIINCFASNIQGRLFGHQIRTTFIDIFSIFLGVAQNHEPKKTYARIILLNFLFFCFIIRSLHQGLF